MNSTKPTIIFCHDSMNNEGRLTKLLYCNNKNSNQTIINRFGNHKGTWHLTVGLIFFKNSCIIVQERSLLSYPCQRELNL